PTGGRREAEGLGAALGGEHLLDLRDVHLLVADFLASRSRSTARSTSESMLTAGPLRAFSTGNEDVDLLTEHEVFGFEPGARFEPASSAHKLLVSANPPSGGKGTRFWAACHSDRIFGNGTAASLLSPSRISLQTSFSRPSD